MKTFLRNIHLYFALVSGLVIAVVCLTGALLVFEKETYFLIYPERYFVEKQNKKLSLDSLTELVKIQVPEAKISSVRIYSDQERTVEISFSKGKERGGQIAFMNPYTGKLIAAGANRTEFFQTVFGLHRWLLADDTGKLIVGISTILFLFILITGIILWWPRNKQALKSRLLFVWNKGWKRINHDLHISLGFYTAIFLFIFAFTGLAWSFKWFNDGIYWITGTENTQMQTPVSRSQGKKTETQFQKIFNSVSLISPNADYYSINKPREKDGVFSVTVLPENAPHERASDQYFYDPMTFENIGQLLYSDRNLGQRVRSIFFPFHVGSIGGIVGRIIAFISCLAGFTFIFTGIILWINRLKRKLKFSD